MKKRTLSLALALMMCLALLPTTASALTEGDWEFQLLDGEAQITGYNGAGGDVVIPSTIRGAVVTEVDEIDMFRGKATSLTYPGSVKKVDYQATFGWEGLTELTFQEGVEEIEGSIIQKFPDLVKIDLPSTLKVIGEHAFRNTGITEISIPSGVKTIKDAAFAESKLKSVDMSGLTNVKLGVNLFNSCKELTSIKLPRDIQTIPQALVQSCTSLTYIDLPATVSKIETTAFEGCDLRELHLPVSLKEIGPGAFGKNVNLSEVVIPYGVTTVGHGGDIIKGSFCDCSGLKALYIPNTVTTMGDGVIDDCDDCIIYCTAGSYVAKRCQEKKISYQTDASVDTRINVIYNGKRVSFGAYGQNPEIVSNRTMVPLRSIFEAMGAQVQWDGATKTVTATRGSDKIVMTAGQNGYTVNGAAKTMDAPPMIMNGRTMVPVRAVAESFGANVTWHSPSATVIISE